MKNNLKKKTAAVLAAVVLAVSALAGCGGSNDIEKTPPYPVTVNNVTVEKAPKAVGTLSPMLTEMLVELGFLKKIVGYSQGEILPEPPPEPEPVSSDGGFRWFWEKKPEPVIPEPMPISGEIGTALAPDFDKIAELLPEIIFTPLPLPSAQMEKLSAVGIKVIVVPVGKAIPELMQNYLSLYSVMAGQNESDEKGKALIDELQRGLSHIEATAAPNKRTFLYVCGTEPLIATKDTYESAMLSYIGTNAAGDAKSYTMTPEELAAANPDMIIFPEGMDPEFFNQSELFKDKSAVQNGQVIPLNKELLADQSLSLTESIISLGAVLQPGTDLTIPPPPEEGASSATVPSKEEIPSSEGGTSSADGASSAE